MVSISEYHQRGLESGCIDLHSLLQWVRVLLGPSNQLSLETISTSILDPHPLLDYFLTGPSLLDAPTVLSVPYYLSQTCFGISPDFPLASLIH